MILLPMAGLLACLACFAGAAQGAKLDDSQSPQQRTPLNLRWADLGGAAGNVQQFHALTGELKAYEVRLNTGFYLGKNVQIHFSLPRNIVGLRSPSAMRVEWTAAGKFAAGSVRPGDRALLFQGKIYESKITEFFDFTVRIDSRYLGRGFQFEPIFEIEILPN